MGGGFIGQLCHIKNYFLDKRCELVALAEAKNLQCQLVAKKYSIPNIFNNHIDLLKSNIEFDAVVVVVNRFLSSRIIFDCIKANKNIFAEKPIALNFKDAIKLTTEAKKRKLLFKIGFNKNYDDGILQGIRQIQKLQKSKELGNLIYVKIRRFSGTGYKNHSGNIQVKEKFSKIPNSNYKFNSIPKGLNKNFYTGFLEYLNVNSHLLSFLTFSINKKPNIDYVHYSKNSICLVVLEYDKKFKVLIESKHYKDHHWDEEFIFYFEKGFVSIKTPPQQLENVSAKVTIFKRDNKESFIILNQKPSWSFRNQAYDFVSDIKKNKIVINNAQDYTNDILVIENIWKKISSQKI